MIERDFPIVLQNTVVSQWKALKEWNPEYIATHVKRPQVSIYQHDSPIFGPYWDTEKPLSKVSTVKRRNAHKVTQIGDLLVQ